MKSKKINIMLRIDPELCAELREAVEADHNSFNGWVLAAVEQRLDRLVIEREDLYNQIRRLENAKGNKH